jgi:cobalt-zinc-cadmium efflux system outer membrane protein
MPFHVRARLACAALTLLCAATADAEPLTIDLPAALVRARSHAPDAIAALARLREAETGRIGARVRFTENPEIELGAGQRFGDPRSTPLEARARQPLELGRRAARITAADAAATHGRAVADADLRELNHEVENAFDDARYADLVVSLTAKPEDVAARVVQAAERRRAAGDVTDLEVDLAKVALGRARSAVAAARAERADAIGTLAVLIGAKPDDVITLAGDLRPAPLTLEVLRRAVPGRADVRALDARARQARAEGALARANGRADLGVWIGYERDEGDSIVVGGISVTLPLWNRSQGERALARARERSAELQRDARTSAASRQVVDAFEAYESARSADEIFERDVTPSLADAEALLERSVDAGQMAVSEYLIARQELLAGRRDQLDRQLALAKAAAMARFVAGVSP